MQRAAERKVRKAKREYLAETAAGLDATQAAIKLKQSRIQSARFIRDTGSFADSGRTGVAGFGRSEAGSATWIVRKDLQNVLEIARRDGKIILSEAQEDVIAAQPFAAIQPLVGKLSNRAVRKWYLYQDSLIPERLDQSRSVEDQARAACEMRNQNRTRARDLMRDQKLRKEMDKTDPNYTFEELVAKKMKKKGMTREEAIVDILRTATKTRQSVNQSLRLE